MEIDRFILNVLLHSKYLSLSWILWRQRGPHHFRWGLHFPRSKGSAADCSWDKIPEVQFILTHNKYRYLFIDTYPLFDFLQTFGQGLVRVSLPPAHVSLAYVIKPWLPFWESDKFFTENLISIFLRIGRNYHFHCCWFSLKSYLPLMWASLAEPLKWKQNSSLFPCAQDFQIRVPRRGK